MVEESTESMLRRMDAQLLDVIGRREKPHSPEREVYANEEAFSDIEMQSLDLNYSISNDDTMLRQPKNFKMPSSDENRNPEDTAPLNLSTMFEACKTELPSSFISEESRSRTFSDSLGSLSFLSRDDENSFNVPNDIGDEIQGAVDAIREEASRVEAALAIQQVKTMENEIKALTSLLDAQNDQIKQLNKEIKMKDNQLATVQLERDLAKADIDSLKSRRLDQQVRNISPKVTSQTRSARLKDVGTCTEPVNFESTRKHRQVNTDSVTESTRKTNTMSSKERKHHSHKTQIDPMCQPVPRYVETRASKASMTSSKSQGTTVLNRPVSRRPPRHRINFEVTPPTSDSHHSRPSAIETASQVRKLASGATQSLSSKCDTGSRSTSFASENAHESVLCNSFCASSQSSGIVQKSSTSGGRGTRPKIMRSISLLEGRSGCFSLRSFEERGTEEPKSRMCGVPPLFRRKRAMHREGGKQQALPRKLIEDRSLQAQVEELAKRLKLSLDNSEGLRKRLAMVSHYYESTVRRLQENIVSLKKEMTRMEADLVKQVASVDRRRREAAKKSERVLRLKDVEIRKLTRERTPLLGA